MNTLQANQTPDENLKTLLVLLSTGRLEPFEIEIIRSLATRTRGGDEGEKPVEKKVIERPSGSSEIAKEEPKWTAEDLVKQIDSDLIQFGVFGTDGRSAGHYTQYMNFKTSGKNWSREIFDGNGKIPDSLKDNRDTIFVELLNQNFGEFRAMRLRVADRRVDHRDGSHTSIIVFVPKTIERKALEELAKDTNGIKRVMGAVLSKANSPLRGAEANVTKSFLV